jgi:flagellar motor switch protein FliN/FliY
MNMADAEWLASEWMARFAEVMQTMTDATPQMHFTGIDELPQAELLWWKQLFSCSPQCPFWVGTREQNWAAIGQSVLLSAGVDNPPAAEIRGTWLGILRQTMGGLAGGLSGRISIQVTCGDGTETDIQRSAGRIFEVSAEIAGSPRVVFYLVISDGLADAVGVPPETKPLEAHLRVAGETSLRPGTYEHMPNVADSRTFELLLDVELPVSVSFGRATLKINQALNLVSGSLIELNRALTDPVELLVNNCIIARGEVVIVEGNYGVRLTEIVSHKERLQQGRRHILS